MSVVEPKKFLPGSIFPSAKASAFGQSFFDPYDLSSDHKNYLTPRCVAETTPGRSDSALCLLNAAMLYLNSPPEAPENWGHNNLNLNDCHSDPTEISSTFGLPDITDWWRQQEETHSKYADLSNLALGIYSIIPPDVEVEASFALGQDAIGWRESKFTGETLHEKVIVRQSVQANRGILAGDCSALDNTETENDFELKIDVEESQLHRMAKVHDFWRCGRAAKTYVVHRRNPTFNTRK